MERENLILRSFEQLSQYLHRTACRLLRDEAEAGDAVQDTFCNVWERARVESPEQVRGYLIRTLRNVCLNKLRQQRLVYTDVPEAPAPESAEPDETERLRQMLLDTLPPTQRKIFLLVTEQELDYETIARRLDMTVEAVRMNLSRARRRLREQYKKHLA